MLLEKKIKSIERAAEKLANSSDISAIKMQLPFYERWLSYFQHERLIHLIVTLLFSLLSMLSLMLYFFTLLPTTLLVFLVFIITDCFYIKHYYILENKVQHLYDIIDIMYSKIPHRKIPE